MQLAAAIPKYKTQVTQRRRIGRDVYTVHLHSTLIVTASVFSGPTAHDRNGEAVITLHSGGYRTRTTKRRMNQVLGALGISAFVYQNNFIWYVKAYDDDTCLYMTHQFYDGMTFDASHDPSWRSGEHLGFGTSSGGGVRMVQSNPKMPSYSSYAR